MEQELTQAAQWLNSAFAWLDYPILQFWHNLALAAGGILTPMMRVITLTGEDGIFLILVSIVMMVIPKTRKTGCCTFLALAIGVVLTNLLIKNLVARPRPYAADPLLQSWWRDAGAPVESAKCFPSGHTTAVTGFSTGFVEMRGKKYLPFGVVYVLVMGASRNYLMVHYPSDVLGAVLVGLFSGIVAAAIVRRVFRWAEARNAPASP